jgi:hypothetical protein
MAETAGVALDMYIARSEGGTFKVVENLDHFDPNECEVGAPDRRGGTQQRDEAAGRDALTCGFVSSGPRPWYGDLAQ